MIFVQLSGMCDHWNGQSQFELWGKQKVSFPTSWNNKICNYQHSQFWRITHDEKVAGARPDMAADQDVPLQADHHQPGQDDDDQKTMMTPLSISKRSIWKQPDFVQVPGLVNLLRDGEELSEQYYYNYIII